MAALVAALERVLGRGRLRRSVIVVGEADEEYGSAGVRDVLAHLAGRAPDWMLATEPTGLRLVTRHKGIAAARLVARGRACHSSDPTQGRNALVALARAILALDALAGELAAGPGDPALGPGTLSIGRAGGGYAFNIVPDRAWLVAERRLVPGEGVDAVRRELESALARAAAADVAIEACELLKPPLGTRADHPAVRTCAAALAAAGLCAEPAAVAFATDAGVFEQAGIPGVVVGPGSVAEAHTARESVAAAEVEAMAEFFVRLLEAPTGG
jgi:acetylornithine deacetylase